MNESLIYTVCITVVLYTVVFVLSSTFYHEIGHADAIRRFNDKVPIRIILRKGLQHSFYSKRKLNSHGYILLYDNRMPYAGYTIPENDYQDFTNEQIREISRAGFRNTIRYLITLCACLTSCEIVFVLLLMLLHKLDYFSSVPLFFSSVYCMIGCSIGNIIPMLIFLSILLCDHSRLRFGNDLWAEKNPKEFRKCMKHGSMSRDAKYLGFKT